MAILLGGTQTESVQRPSQTASAMGSGLGGILGTLGGLLFALPTGGLSAVAAPAMAGAVATAGLGASVGGSIGSSLGGAIGSAVRETQNYEVAAAPGQQMGLAQALTEMDLPIPAADVATAGIGDLELDSTFGAMPSYLQRLGIRFSTTSGCASIGTVKPVVPLNIAGMKTRRLLRASVPLSSIRYEDALCLLLRLMTNLPIRRCRINFASTTQKLSRPDRCPSAFQQRMTEMHESVQRLRTG